MESNIIQQLAESYYISHPEHSYAIFQISEKGDFAINSDYGISSFAWRSFGQGQTMDEFKKFLISLDEHYWKGKMQYNLNYMQANKSNITAFLNHVYPLFKDFQKHLKANQTLTTIST